MKNSLNKLLVAIMALCMAFTAVFSAACINPQPEEPADSANPATDGYIISVVYPDGKPVKGTDTGNTRTFVYTYLTDSTGKALTEANNGKLNDNGTASLNFKTPGEYNIIIGNLPDGYTYDAQKTNENDVKYTITLKLKNAKYDVMVFYPDGANASNLDVYLNKDGNTAATAKTNENGTATFNIEAGLYDITLGSTPGYIYKSSKTNMGDGTIFVPLYKYSAIDFNSAAKFTQDDIDEWDKTLNGITTPFNVNVDTYKLSEDLRYGDEVFYSLYSEEGGRYNIYAKEDSYYKLSFYNSDLRTASTDIEISGKTNNGNNMYPLYLDAGQTIYISVSLLDNSETRELFLENAHHFEFAISDIVPEPHTEDFGGETGTRNIKFTSNSAYVKFRPNESGIYRISSSSDIYDLNLICYNPVNKPVYDLETGEIMGDDDSGEGKNFSYTEEVQNSYVGNTYTYYLTIKDSDVEYPVEVPVTITRIGDASEERRFTVTDMTTNASVTFADQEGTFHWMPLDGSLPVSQHADGLWYVEIEPGREVKLVAAINKDLRGIGFSFATVELVGEGRPSAGSGEETKKTYNNTYLTVAKDLEQYKDESVMIVEMCNYRSFIETYEGLVNGDGVYEVNSELKTFLERYLNMRGSDISSFLELTVANGCEWLIGCGYYA